MLPEVCLRPRHEKYGQFDLINIFCLNETENVSGMQVCTEPSKMRIGEARFEQLATVFGFRVANAIFPRKKMLFKTLLMPTNSDKYALFLPKLPAYTSSY